jgi:predicted HTH domain antitoxin
MSISFDLPSEIEDQLRHKFEDLEHAAKIDFLIARYREGKLSIGQVARILGFNTRFQAEEWLGQQGVNMNYSLEDLEADRKTLATLFGDGV